MCPRRTWGKGAGKGAGKGQRNDLPMILLAVHVSEDFIYKFLLDLFITFFFVDHIVVVLIKVFLALRVAFQRPFLGHKILRHAFVVSMRT